jgi:uncharacterized protein
MDSVVHFEIPADDVDRADKFYSEAFGWKILPVPWVPVPYHIVHTAETDDQGMIQAAGAVNGAIAGREGVFQAPVLVMGVDDIDAALAKVVKAGGKIVQAKEPVGDMGIYARATDTEGNLIGVFQPLTR